MTDKQTNDEGGSPVESRRKGRKSRNRSVRSTTPGSFLTSTRWKRKRSRVVRFEKSMRAENS